MTEQDSFQRQVEANLPWNFGVNLVDAMFYSLGLNLVSQATIMPLLVSELTSSKVAIGLIPATYSVSFLLPQILTANHTGTLRRQKPFVLPLAFWGERLPYLLIGLIVWRLAVPAPVLALVAFFLLWATTAASNGTITPAWYSMIAKVIPVQRRGLWSGLGHSLGALLGIAGAGLAARILAGWSYPDSYALCFVLAFASVMVSFLGLALTREPPSPTVKLRSSQRHYLRQLPALLRRDGNYVRFLISQSVANLGAMAGGFFMVYGKENIPGALEQVGGLTAILVGSQAVMNLLWGMVADRRGHKVVLCGAALFMAAAAFTALAATTIPGSASPAWLWAAFALLGTSMSGNAVSRMNIILEFCAAEDHPTYIGLTHTLLAPTMLAPVLGGWLATWAGYRGLFSAAATVSLLGAALLAWWVQEPRSVRVAQHGARDCI
jgi:MFS family permease